MRGFPHRARAASARASLWPSERAALFISDRGGGQRVPEEPFRVYQQFRLAAESLAVVRGHAEIQPDDIAVVRKLALASILHRRYEAMQAIQQSPGLTVSVAEAQSVMRLERSQAYVWLNDLVDIGLCQKDGDGYRPVKEFEPLLRVPEDSGELPTIEKK